MADVTTRLIIQAINNSSSVLNAINSDLGSLKGVAIAVSRAIQGNLTNSFIAANAELDRMKRAFDAIAGAGTGQLEYDRLTVSANKLGLSLDALSSSYTQLKAASIGTSLEGIKTDRAFQSVAGAMSVLGANTNQTKNAFLAISQMVSKGTVSMEELRRQLAQHLPGALNIFARALNVSVQELYKLVKAGKVGIPEMEKFFDQINKEYDPSKLKAATFEQNIARINNAIKAVNVSLGQTGAWQIFTDIAALTATGINNAAGSIQSDVIAMSAIWDSWGNQFNAILNEADSALNGFLTDFQSNTAEIDGIAHAIRESIAFIGQALQQLPSNIKASVVILTSEVGQALIDIRAGFDLLWAYASNSAAGATISIRTAFQSVVVEINAMLASMASTMANSLVSLGSSGDFIPGFQSGLNSIADGLFKMQSIADGSTSQLNLLKTAADDLQKGYEAKKAAVLAAAAAEKQAWQDVTDSALVARDKQIQAQNDLIANRLDSAAYDKQEQALWARRVENIKGATAAIADQASVGKTTAKIIKELADVKKESISGKSGSAGSELDATIAIVKVQKLRNELSAESSEEKKQEYLDSLKVAEQSAKALSDDNKRLAALSLLSEETKRLKENGVIPDATIKSKVSADITEAQKQIEFLRKDVAGVPAFQQVLAEDERARETINGLIEWANSQSATIQINAQYSSSGTPPSFSNVPAGDSIERHWGGYVPGRGNTDSVRAMLTPGEYVIRKSSVQRLGIPFLQALNRGGRERSIDRLHIPSMSTQHFANGGVVAPGATDFVQNFFIDGKKVYSGKGTHEQGQQLANLLTKLGRSS